MSIPEEAGAAAAAPEPPGLELDGLARRFGRSWALRGITLRVRPGEVVGLIGPNGSGKTTLLRVVSTLLRPSRGIGRVYGLDLARDADRVRPLVGLLAHTTGLYEDLTALENLRFAARMRGLDGRREHLEDLLEAVTLGREADRRVRTFSSGMRRRLALARILLEPPRLFLLDEPYASFDPEGIALLERSVRSVAAQGGTVVVATHDLPRSSRLVDRFIRMEAGRVTDESVSPEPHRARPSARALEPTS